jgi:hypothetical protein
MKRARLYVDFNEMVDSGRVLLAKTDTKVDSAGNVVHLSAGQRVHVYMDELADDGTPDNLIADGTVEPNTAAGSWAAARWCCRIDARGIRNESDDDGGDDSAS